jgi:hypothetical protein
MENIQGISIIEHSSRFLYATTKELYVDVNSLKAFEIGERPRLDRYGLVLAEG